MIFYNLNSLGQQGNEISIYSERLDEKKIVREISVEDILVTPS